MANNIEGGRELPVRLEDEIKRSYIDYAMSVIIGRALPDVRDGLKPVHRRILYAMWELGITSDKPHKKSAVVVGTVLAKFHPHGDVAVYDAMVRLAQTFSTHYLLIDGHGNFGSVDGDAPAAMRYTEARLSSAAEEMLVELGKETVDFIANYDDTTKEPLVLPSRLPNLLINGSSGIAVGMATNIPPHNLTEIVNGLVRLIDNPEMSLAAIMEHIKGPDFPTGGIILGKEGIRSAFSKGRGSIKVRARTEVETNAAGKKQILVKELPYMVNKARLVERIAELVRDRKIEGISDLRDESDRKGMRVVIELKRGAEAGVILNQLYRHTQMEDTFGVIMLALVDGKPQVLSLMETLNLFIKHRKEVVIRRTRFELNKAQARAHIVEGLRIALTNLDEVIKVIRSSSREEEAKQNLIQKFSLSEKQAQAILDMRLRRLTALEREKLEAEYRELQATIGNLQGILDDVNKVMSLVKKELLEVRDKYGDARRTAIAEDPGNPNDDDFIVEENIVVTITHHGYVKRLPMDTYRSQRRGGRGIAALTRREEDFVQDLYITSTHNYLLFFTNMGRVRRLKAYDVPEATRYAKGTPLVNVLGLQENEKVTAIIPVRSFDDSGYLFMATKKGMVKKTSLHDFNSSRKDGLIAIILDQDDELVGVQLTRGNEQLILGTKKGLVIRFSEGDVRPIGRGTKGVRGITLGKKDQVVAMERAAAGKQLLTVTKNGFGKRTLLQEYRIQSRGGKGILTFNRTERTGELATFMMVDEDDEIMLITSDGVIIRMAVEGVSLTGRNTQGVKLMRLDESDHIVAVAKVEPEVDK